MSYWQDVVGTVGIEPTTSTPQTWSHTACVSSAGPRSSCVTVVAVKGALATTGPVPNTAVSPTVFPVVRSLRSQIAPVFLPSVRLILHPYNRPVTIGLVKVLDSIEQFRSVFLGITLYHIVVTRDSTIGKVID